MAWGRTGWMRFVIGTDRALYHKWWNGLVLGPSLTDYEAIRVDLCTVPASGAVGTKPAGCIRTGGPITRSITSGGTARLGVRASRTMNAWVVFVSATPKSSRGDPTGWTYSCWHRSAVYHKWWDGSIWGPSLTGYERMGGVCSRQPEVVAWGPNRLDVFVVGTDQRSITSGGTARSWGPSLAGMNGSGVCVRRRAERVAWGPNRLDVFVVGTDLALYHKWWDGSLLGSFARLGRTHGRHLRRVGPGAVAGVPTAWMSLLLGPTMAVYHKWWDGANGGPGLTGTKHGRSLLDVAPRVTAWGPIAWMFRPWH